MTGISPSRWHRIACSIWRRHDYQVRVRAHQIFLKRSVCVATDGPVAGAFQLVVRNRAATAPSVCSWMSIQNGSLQVRSSGPASYQIDRLAK